MHFSNTLCKGMIILKFMSLAIQEAKKAMETDEIPVGCVITLNDNVIAQTYNRTIEGNNPTYHAEMLAINNALNCISNRNLEDCNMYVTLEPCPMCAGAIINSRIKRLYIGAPEPKSGCFGSIADFNQMGFNHKPEVYCGIHEDECKKLMTDFFKNKR